jgi:hypothetical protein
MGLFDGIKKAFKKVTGAIKKVVKGVAKGVKKVVKGVGKVIKKVGKGVKKLAKNKIVRAALMITAAVMLPGAIAAIGPAFATTTLANAAVTGAIMGGGGALLAGGDLKDVLKGAALGSATGAAFRGIANKVNQLGAQPTVDSGTTVDSGITFNAPETIDVSTLPRDALGQVDLNALGTTSVSPQGALSFSESTGLYTDSLGRSFSADLSGNFTSVGPTFQVTNPLEISKDLATDAQTVFGQVPSMGEQVAQAKIDVTDSSFRQAAGLPEITDRTPTYGDRLKDSVKDAFSPENVVNRGLAIGENLLVGAAQGALAARMQDGEYVGDPAYAQQEYANQLEQFQIAYQDAGINITDAYANMTYGSGDINAVGSELFRQDTIRIV